MNGVRVAVKVTEFWRAVDHRGPDECWPWTGYVNEDGYGEFFFDGRMRGAHELAVTFTTGEVRDSILDTCHRCGTRPCCNPAHIRFDTRASNIADAVRHGTNYRGGSKPKLSDFDVGVIRLRLASGARGDVLAAEFGVSQSMVSQIKSGRRRAS